MKIPEHLINDEPQIIGEPEEFSIGPPITEEQRQRAIERREKSLSELPNLDADRGLTDAERRRRYNSGSFMPISAREWRLRDR